MRELVEEQKYGREVTQDLVAAKDAVVGGDTFQLKNVLEAIGKLVDFYPQHIAKEDDHFFPDTERHYDKEELDRMLKEFYDFDMQMIHEKYQKTVEALEREAKS